MTDSFEWQGRVGDSWAAERERTDRSLAPVQAALLERMSATATAPRRILDIGCGAGTTTIAAAARFPEADCLGIDLSRALIDAARARPATDNCAFQTADAASWSDPAFVPDALMSRHGVMFFADPVAAFSHLGACAAPAARLVFSCFRTPAENPWASGMTALLPAQPASNPDAPGPFAFADPARVAHILAASGWKDAHAEPFDWEYVAGAGDDAVADALAFFQQIGPAARAARSLPDAERTAFLSRLERLLRENLTGGKVTFRAAAWIWTARR
jgi:SAM-dependent methyltransferase